MTYQYYFNAKPKLLAVLQMGGATDQIFTAQQVSFFEVVSEAYSLFSDIVIFVYWYNIMVTLAAIAMYNW